MNSGYFLAYVKSVKWHLGVWLLVSELEVIGFCGRGTDVGLRVFLMVGRS